MTSVNHRSPGEVEFSKRSIDCWSHGAASAAAPTTLSSRWRRTERIARVDLCRLAARQRADLRRPPSAFGGRSVTIEKHWVQEYRDLAEIHAAPLWRPPKTASLSCRDVV